MADIWRRKSDEIRHPTTDALLNGGKLYYYDAGTTSERTVYKDAAEGTAWTQPITLDSSGRPSDDIYVPTGSFKEVLKTSGDTELFSSDNLNGAVSIPSASYAAPRTPILTKATDYTILAADLGSKVEVDASGGDRTITLIAAASATSGDWVIVQNVGVSGAVIIDGNGSEEINGETSITLTFQYNWALLICDGSEWKGFIFLEELSAVGQASIDVASATETDIGAVNSTTVRITGTETITSLGTVKAGVERWLLFADALTLTHNGTSLILPGAANITTAAGDVAHFKSEGSGNWRCYHYFPLDASTSNPGLVELATEAEAAARTDTARVASVAVAPFMPGHLFGLTLSNNGSDATNDIDIAAGSARDGDDDVNMILASALTKRLDAAWAVGTGNGGLDTGSIADTTYHVWLIKRSDTGVVDALFSASASSPTMPSNYDYKRRIGSIIRASSAIVAFLQNGDVFMRSIAIRSINSNNPGTSAVTRTLNVPVGVAVEAVVTHGLYDVTANAITYGLLTALTAADSTPSASIYDVRTPDSGGQTDDSVTRNIRTNASAQIRSRLSASNTDITEDIIVHGWIDTRGRLG